MSLEPRNIRRTNPDGTPYGVRMQIRGNHLYALLDAKLNDVWANQVGANTEIKEGNYESAALKVLKDIGIVYGVDIQKENLKTA